jgi:hypothetical protein
MLAKFVDRKLDQNPPNMKSAIVRSSKCEKFSLLNMSIRAVMFGDRGCSTNPASLSSAA